MKFDRFRGPLSFVQCPHCGSLRTQAWFARPYPGHNLSTVYECQCGAAITLGELSRMVSIFPGSEPPPSLTKEREP